jgi:hypothetical protein
MIFFFFVILQPVASSRESVFPGKENARANGNTNYFDEADTVICSRSSQDKRSRKTSTVCFNFLTMNWLKLLPAYTAVLLKPPNLYY